MAFTSCSKGGIRYHWGAKPLLEGAKSGKACFTDVPEKSRPRARDARVEADFPLQR
jgi:predicted  nucleic acid-binding Zn-ribbon protein